MKSIKLVKRSTILLICLLAAGLTSALFSCKKAEVVAQSYDSPEAKVGQTTTCPVMKSKFTIKENTKYAKVNGTKYYVCCPMCIDKIKDNPDKYLKN